MTEFLDGLLSFAPSALALLGLILVTALLQRWLDTRTPSATKSHRTRNQVILLGVLALGVLLVILLLPIGDTVRGQILSLIGIVLSAGVALSSTTFLGNMLGGLMLRAVKSFRTGDFIQVEGHFGRVSERGLFHTEIQTENRELTTLPNLYLVTNPVTTVRSSGTVVSATVSLGYDVSHVRIEALLREAAARAGLTDAFVFVQELGDFSVTYRVAGMLADVESLITARSRLRTAVLDALHDGEVEIVSPTFMNQRRLEADQRFIPRVVDWTTEPTPATAAPEDLVFDKAQEAETKEKTEDQLERVAEEIVAVKSDLEAAAEGTKAPLERTLQRLETRRDRLEESIESPTNSTPADKGGVEE